MRKASTALTAAATAAALAGAACGKTSRAAAPDAAEAVAPRGSVGEDGGLEPMGDRERAAWKEAADSGEPSEILRLADLVGCSGLRERAAGDPSLTALAVRAMRHCPDFTELPWLADVAMTGTDDLAAEALDSIVDQAARPRRAVDPEDAEELHAGCATLLALARAADRPRPRRIGAVRALRMLADRGCVARADIPTDVDAK